MQYTSCFVGIPLPLEFHERFRELAEAIYAFCPSLDGVDLTTPHITIYYLNEQSQDNLGAIVERTERLKLLLRDARLSIGGMGLFSPDQPRVLYCDVVYDSSLVAFHEQITSALSEYHAPDNDFGFKPHLTMARIPRAAREEFDQQRKHISDLLRDEKWTFVIRELCLYGVDSRMHPERQSPIAHIVL